MPDTETTNALAQAASPYLRSAAHQPVEWQEWSRAAFERAAREDKPILLDIGAIWCHWCHVLDRESYENPEIAQLINEHFVAIKVDRDERPDIDARYQTAVTALTGEGGWPLTVFLTPDGKPFFGGTYFPPEDAGGRPGMKRLLRSVAETYRAQRDRVAASAEQIAQALGRVEQFSPDGQRLGPGLVDAILSSIERMFDPRHGGFGSHPKFPHPSAIDLLLDRYLETRREPWLTMVTVTLEHMARGGIYDQLGGGFHRYSVDERWMVPHFEKMSYDNAALLSNYLRAYQITGNDFFREISLGILAFIESTLSDPSGGFYASQDADYSLNDDGDYFTWTLEEVKAALSEAEAAVISQRYHIEEQGEMHHNPAKNVLFIDQPFEAIAARLKLTVAEVERLAASGRAKLLAARSRRPAPFVDPTLYAGWNGLMASALIDAYKALGLEGARDRALMALERFLAQAYDPARGVYHSLVEGRARVEGLLDDQVFLAAALLDAFEVTGRRAYFDQALELMEITLRRFGDDKDGGFFDTAKDREAPPGGFDMPRKAFQDSPTPAANPMAALVLDRLAALADRPDFRHQAEATLALFASRAEEYGLHAATYGRVVANHLRPAVEVVVVGEKGDERTERLWRTACEPRRAGQRALRFEPAAIQAGELPAGLAATLPHLPLDRGPLALVCMETSCRPPVWTPEDLASQLSTSD
jgi:uncharacterized protein YyaL (SSP411 family)